MRNSAIVAISFAAAIPFLITSALFFASGGFKFGYVTFSVAVLVGAISHLSLVRMNACREEVRIRVPIR